VTEHHLFYLKNNFFCRN